MKKKNFNAFTLAEVLITLGIIGVVAALTIPTLISSYQKKEYVTRLQKGISILNNGVQLMMADEGVYNFDQLAFHKCYEASGSSISLDETARSCINNYFSKYFKIVDYSKITNDTNFYPYTEVLKLNGTSGMTAGVFAISAYYGFLTQDGMLLYPMSFPGIGDALIDINGKQKPNQIGRDIFMLDRNNGLYSAHGKDTWDDTSEANDYCGDENPTAGYGCAGRIMAEGWKMNY